MFLLFDSCYQCPDKNFEAKFNNTIKTLELLKTEGITPRNNIDSIKIASQILTSLTGIRPHIAYNYTVTYLEKDFENDSNEWHKWYEENKCKMNEAMFDSTALKVRANYQK
jgi:hypothetical protein